MIGGLLLSAYNYELGHWGVFYYFKKLTAGLQESSWRRNTKVRLTIYGKGGRVQGEEMVSGKNIWGRKGKLGSSEEKERKGEERNEENGVADFGVDLGSAYDGAGGACGGTGGGGRGRPGGGGFRGSAHGGSGPRRSGEPCAGRGDGEPGGGREALPDGGRELRRGELRGAGALCPGGRVEGH